LIAGKWELTERILGYFVGDALRQKERSERIGKGKTGKKGRKLKGGRKYSSQMKFLAYGFGYR